jgi:hypothetical protein
MQDPMPPPIPHIEKILSLQTPHATLIQEQMSVFKMIPNDDNGKYNCMFTFVAFGNTTDRSLLLTCLMYSLEPDLVYSAYVKSYDNKEYETILLMRKKISMDLLERFLDLFRMSTCIIPFDVLMADEMATSIARIHAGSNQYGNFHSRSNTNLRRKYYYRRQQQKKTLELKRVLDVTGLSFSPDNMMRLYHELTISRCENANFRARINNYQERVAALRI